MNYDIKKILSNYFKIINNENKPNYIKTKNQIIDYSKFESTKELWRKHNLLELTKINKTSNKNNSKLDLKIELVSRILKSCILCENRCKINRNIEFGKCKIKDSIIASDFVHYGEEKILIPSYTIFFSSCNFKCVYCQNWNISQILTGEKIKPKELVKKIINAEKMGIKNINWVGGEPTPNIYFILKTLKECNLNLPQIWNSNMYCSKETMNILYNLIDLYLTDFKYGNDKCASKYSKIDNYSKIIKRNHKIANKNGEMIIRHLVLPNHIECCSKPILKWINNNLPNTPVNIMNQYKPFFKAIQYQDIRNNVQEKEFNDLINYSKKLNINLI